MQQKYVLQYLFLLFKIELANYYAVIRVTHTQEYSTINIHDFLASKILKNSKKLTQQTHWHGQSHRHQSWVAA